MKDFEGKVAVVTGGASGIGYGIAEKCVKSGMHLVVADLKLPDIEKAIKDLSRHANGDQKIVPFPMDCANKEDNQKLLNATLQHFNSVNLAFFNAGVAGGIKASSLLDGEEERWRWVEEVNFWGVYYGAKVFGTKMVELAKSNPSYEGHIVNTASAAGYGAGFGAYSTSKHSCVALTETLIQDFYNKEVFPRLSASVLCPFFVQTNIVSKYLNIYIELN